MKQIYGFLTYLHTILNGTCQDLSYIPVGYESRYHYLVLRGTIFILLHHMSKSGAKRNRSEIHMLKVKNFQVIIGNVQFFNHFISVFTLGGVL